MSTDLELSRRLVACEGFRWMAGMLTDSGVRIFGHDSDGDPWGHISRGGYSWLDHGDAMPCLPELSDPATLGCIEHGLLPDVYGPHAHLAPTRHGWVVWPQTNGPAILTVIDGRERAAWGSKAEALVAALEAAPKKEAA